MKKPEYLVTDLWAIILFPFIILAGALVLAILQELIPAVVVFVVAIVIGICEFIGRKWLFSKILINDIGVIISFKESINKQIKWKDIKDSMVNSNMFGGGILISTEEYDADAKQGKEFIEKNNHGITLNLSIKYVFDAMCKYFYKIPVPVKNFNKLPIKTQEIFQKIHL